MKAEIVIPDVVEDKVILTMTREEAGVLHKVMGGLSNEDVDKLIVGISPPNYTYNVWRALEDVVQ